MENGKWQPIETAPKDGTEIYVADPDCGAFVMRWNAVGYNDIFAPYDVGIWEMPGGGATWSESRDAGPTRWKPLEGGCDGWDSPLPEPHKDSPQGNYFPWPPYDMDEHGGY